MFFIGRLPSPELVLGSSLLATLSQCRGGLVLVEATDGIFVHGASGAKYVAPGKLGGPKGTGKKTIATPDAGRFVVGIKNS